MPLSFYPAMSRGIAAYAIGAVVALFGLSAASTECRAADQKDAPQSALVIIAPREFQASLAEFVAHKQKLLPTELVVLEEMLPQQTGVDDAEKLKRFLFDRWKAGHVGYALLVGDANLLPIRYMTLDRETKAAFHYSFYPSDLYYADVARSDGSFDDWNAQRDGFHGQYFGEVRGEHNKDDAINYDAVSYLPEIAIGRWPVSSPEQVARVAAKTIRYENGLLARDPHAAQPVAAFFAVAGWVDSRGTMDKAADNLTARFQIEKRYYASRRSQVRTTPRPNLRELSKLLGDGADIVFHAGHGEKDRWVNCCTLQDLMGVDTASCPPILVSAGCDTAHFAPLAPYEAYTDVTGAAHKGTDHGETFDAPPPPPSPYQSLSPQLVGFGKGALINGENGAVAYIGCNTGSQPCGLTLLEGFTSALGTAEQPRLGDAWNAAVKHYHDAQRLDQLQPTADWYPPSIFFQAMKFMVFADPTLQMPAARSADESP